MTQSKTREAACACGQFKIQLSGDPQLVSSCHCLACQRRTGSLFGVQAFFRQDQVVSVDGERRAFRRQADSGTWVTSQFCPHCGSTVFWERPNLPGMITVAVGSFADPQFPGPVRTVWTTTKHDWFAFPPNIPHHKKAPPA
jgi:hypothetical protein